MRKVYGKGKKGPNKTKQKTKIGLSGYRARREFRGFRERWRGVESFWSEAIGSREGNRRLKRRKYLSGAW